MSRSHLYTMYSSSSSSIAVVLLCLGGLLHAAADSPLPESGSEEVGFYVEVIHRDSPDSPFHDPSATPFSRLRDAICRSAARAAQFRRTTSSKSRLLSAVGGDIISSVTNSNFEYLMSFYLGTPPRQILAQLDTGSDLIWVQCSPCDKCYRQGAPLFNPKASSTYKILPCHADSCSQLRLDSCGVNASCNFRYDYNDQSFVEGLLSTDTLSFDSSADSLKIKRPGMVFGCSHRSSGTFTEADAGLVGLGSGRLSLIRQLGSIAENKFSYCLPLITSYTTGVSKPSWLYFGSAAAVSGSRAVATPLHVIPDDTFYYVDHESVVVKSGGARKTIRVKRAQVGPLGHPQTGNMIIDSGTTVTFIDKEAMKALSKVVVDLVHLPRVDVPEDIAGIIDLCFDWGKATEETRLPEITFRFAGGAAVVLKEDNAYALVEEKTMCLIIASNVHNGGLSLFGGMAQMSYRLGFDLAAGTLSFLPDVC